MVTYLSLTQQIKTHVIHVLARRQHANSMKSNFTLKSILEIVAKYITSKID